jgi:multidrug resistance efflux pump
MAPDEPARILAARDAVDTSTLRSAALLLTIAGVLFAAASALAQSTGTAPAAAPTSPAQTQPAAGPLVVIAGVEPQWAADQYAKTSGYVAEVKADIGDRVAKGQVLAVIDVPELAKELAAAQATLVAKQEMAKAAEATVRQSQTALEVAKRVAEGAKAEQQLAQATLKRQEELFADKAATAQQIDEVRARAEVARSAAAVTEAKIAAAEADLAAAQANAGVARANAAVAAAEAQRVEALVAYTRIVAPFDGVITRRQVNPGELVQATMTSRPAPLFTVQQIDTVRIVCDVPEASAASAAAGDPAEIKLFAREGQPPIRAAVTRVATALNPSTRTMRLEIELPNADGRLRPGMYAQVTLHPGPAASAATGAAR